MNILLGMILAVSISSVAGWFVLSTILASCSLHKIVHIHKYRNMMKEVGIVATAFAIIFSVFALIIML